MVPLHTEPHPTKLGDVRLNFGTACQKISQEAYYAPKSHRYKAVYKHPKTGFPKAWNFHGRLRGVRDEVDKLALIGLNAQNERVVFHMAQVGDGTRYGNVFLGPVARAGCKLINFGMPIVQGMYVVSRKALEALDAAGVPGADKANLTLEAFSIYAGVDKYGRVKGRFGIRFDGNTQDKQKALEYGELGFDTMLEKVSGKPVDVIEVSAPRSATNIKDGLTILDVYLDLDDWMSAVDALHETVTETDQDWCKAFD